MSEKPYDPVPAVAGIIAKRGFDGAAWDLLADAYRALREHIPGDSGLLLEIRELLDRHTSRLSAPAPTGYGDVTAARARARAESTLRIAERRAQADAEARMRAGVDAPTEQITVTPDGSTRLPDAMRVELELIPDGGHVWFLRGRDRWEAWLEADLAALMVPPPPVFPPEEETRSRVHAIAPTFDTAPADAPGLPPAEDAARPVAETLPSLEERVQALEKRLERHEDTVADLNDGLADVRRDISILRAGRRAD